jgi:ribosomal protein S18 acetylase RimI-like enzyme
MADMTVAPVLRRLAPDEWTVARDLRVAAISDSPAAFGSTVERERSLPPEAWHGRLSGNAWFAAFHEAEPVGLACAVRVAVPEERELTGVWVSPELRGTGVGDALVVAVRDWARVEGARRLTLEVMEGNAQAIALYRRHGFRATERSEAVSSHPHGTAVMSLDLL